MEYAGIAELRDWAASQADRLKSNGVTLELRMPAPPDPLWKASIGITYDRWIAAFTVWDRGELQTDLMVLNTSSGEIVHHDELRGGRKDLIRQQLDSVIDSLLGQRFP